MTTTAYFDPSITGSGKTYSALRHFIDKQQPTLIAVPSLHLVESYKTDIAKICSHKGITCLYESVTCEDTAYKISTKKLLKERIDSANNKQLPVIILTTHETFKRALLEGITGLEGWHLLIDECIDLFATHEYKLSSLTAAWFVDKMKYNTKRSDGIVKLSLKKSYHDQAKKIIDGSIRDSFFGTDADKSFLSHAVSSSFSTYITNNDLQKALNVSLNLYGAESAKFYTLSVINSRVLKQFDSITILSALFDQTVLYKALEISGLRLVRKVLSDRATPLHINGSRLHIHYFTNRNNSISYRATVKNGYDYEDRMINYFHKIIGTSRFIFNANEASRPKYARYQALPGQDIKTGQGALVKAVAGVNDFDQYTHALYMTSKNLDESQGSVLEAFGIDRQFANDDRNLLSAYQFISRSSIRVAGATGDVHVYVVDKRTAYFLAGLYPDSTLVKHDIPDLVNTDIDNKPDNAADDRFMRRTSQSFEKGQTKFKSSTVTRYIDLYDRFNMSNNDALYTHMKTTSKKS